MAASRDCLNSRMSAASTGTSMLLDRQHGNCMEMVRDLYTILEPQLCKSYRTNVKYIPPAHPVDFQQHTLHPPHFDRRKHKAVKTARIVIEAVNQFQARPDHSSSTPNPKATLEPGKLAAKEKSDVKLEGKLAKEKSDVKLDGSKESSQSLPNLTVTS